MYEVHKLRVPERIQMHAINAFFSQTDTEFGDFDFLENSLIENKDRIYLFMIEKGYPLLSTEGLMDVIAYMEVREWKITEEECHKGKRMISLDDHEGQSTIANMHIDHSQVKYDAYQKHQVFELIDHMMDYYEGISDTSFSFIPNGTLTFGNYATYVYMSIRSTLDSIKMLLKAGHITDAFVLIRKLFDTVLVEIYLNVVREDQFDWMKCIVVKDVDEWLRKGHWIPKTEKILSVLKESKSTKDLYPMFGWDTYLKKNRSLLDNHVHASSYRSILLNCQDIHIDNREKELKNASIILNQIMLLHLSFNFYLNGQYMMASDYMDYRDMNMEPPEGSESWIAPYAQEAFDEFIKPHPRLAEFIREHCCLDIA